MNFKIDVNFVNIFIQRSMMQTFQNFLGTFILYKKYFCLIKFLIKLVEKNFLFNKVIYLNKLHNTQ